MMELFDMGKYNFYVWGSVAVFFIAMLADYISVSRKHKQIKRLIKAKGKRQRNQSANRRNNRDTNP